MERSVLKRSLQTMDTILGEADVKVVEDGKRKRYYPEYRTAAAIAEEKKMPLREVMRIIEMEAGKKL